MQELIDMEVVRAKLGGSRPVSRTTVYRRVKDGTLPEPMKIGPREIRWKANEVEAALQRLADARGEPPKDAE